MSRGPVRPPAVAGQFYSGTAEGLRREIESCYQHRLGPGELPVVNENGPREIMGLVSPHAGYMYSGPTAAQGYYQVAADGRPETLVVISPSHRPVMACAVIQTTGAWATPLGQAVIDGSLAGEVAEHCPLLVDSPEAFAYEHSLEVQLPFLQHLYGPDVKFVPIMMVDQDWEVAEQVGQGLVQALAGRDALIIASTDMTHQEPAVLAKEQDMLLVERMKDLDAQGLLEARARRGITMCGYGPTAAMIVAATGLGARQAEFIAYSTSGDVQPMATVVGYVSLKVTR